MAETFLPNPKGLKVVIFKDNDITNYKDLNNLQWVTRETLNNINIMEKTILKRNKFKEGEDLPGTAVSGLPMMVLSNKLLVKKTEARIEKEYSMLDLKKRRVKAKYKASREKLEAATSLRERTITNSQVTNQEMRLREIETAFNFKLNRINKLEQNKLFLLSKEVVATSKIKLETNRYFNYKGEQHKITDTGASLVIRIKESEKWVTRSVAAIVLEDIMNIPKPGKVYHVGYRNFDHRNITDANLIWETCKQKHARYYELMPVVKLLKAKKVRESNAYEINPFKVASIKTYLEKGNTIKAISRKVGIPYYTVYRFCKSKGLLSNSAPTKTDIIKTNHDKIVEMLRQGQHLTEISNCLDLSYSMLFRYATTNNLRS
jgi:hypothetical protein